MKTFILVFLFGFSAQAANVAVVDSGTDFEHALLNASAWTNPGEIPGDRIDNDRNGKVDDVHGWNFVDNFHRLFFREHLSRVNPIVYPLLRVIGQRQGGEELSPQDERFFQENYGSLPEPRKRAVSAHLNYFAMYSHGTHVAGVVLQQSPDAKIMSARVFPDQPPPPYPSAAEAGPVDWIYRILGMVTNGTFQNVGQYLNETKMDLANFSMAISLPMIARLSLGLQGNSSPSPEEIAKEVRRIYVQFEPEGKKWMAAAPDTLFVVAAGNDGLDNDIQPVFPANVRADNAISVAATHGFHSLAKFSNYGAASVDVAAPGVAVLSSVPSLDRRAELPMSGTSMAAPFVTGVAAQVKDENPALKPAELRRILMGTVDRKDWLQGKVVSSGLVNPERAALAGRLSRDMGVEAAIAAAKTRVADQPEVAPRLGASSLPELEELAVQLVF
jgi:cell wall-associated protease